MTALGTLVAIFSLACGGAEEKGEGPRRPPVTRADLALALQRFERAFLSHRPEGDALVDANLAFEDVTQSFFRMNFVGAIAKLNEKALELSLGRKPTDEEKWLASMKVTVDPPVVVTGAADPVIQLSPMYASEGARPGELTVVLTHGEQVERIAVPVGSAEAPIEVPLVAKGGSWSGTWEIALELRDGLRLESGRRLIAVPEDLDTVCESHAARLSKIEADGDLASALATCRARNELLKMVPSEGRSIEFLADYNRLARDIGREVAALEAGENPYAGRKGDIWRVVVVGKTRIPVRVYCPASVSLDDASPLVIVLHGAGGDENMFLDAYGEGAIKREADEHGFVVASPATFFFTTSGKNLEPLIDAISNDYSIDRDRVYVLGHSMGGGAAAIQARENSEIVAAACCIAGGRGFGDAKKISPTLVVAAELDAIVPSKAIEAGARSAIDAGLPVEFRKVSDYGHTMVVEAELGHCIDWLLQHRLAAR